MMFREMKRIKQQLSEEMILLVMERGTNGVLSTIGDEGYPYGVPVNYVYSNNKIYFHCAKEGHKIDSIIHNPKVSFTVIDEDKIVSSEYTSYFRSVIAFGKARITDGDEWISGFRALVEKYSGDQPNDAKDKMIMGCHKSHIVAIDIEHITGKEAIELVNSRKY